MTVKKAQWPLGSEKAQWMKRSMLATSVSKKWGGILLAPGINNLFSTNNPNQKTTEITLTT